MALTTFMAASLMLLCAVSLQVIPTLASPEQKILASNAEENIGISISRTLLVNEVGPRPADISASSGVTNFVAFGDSYAAGIGAGVTQLGGCRKGDHAYPYLLNDTDPDFNLLNSYACTGATTYDLIKEGGQIDQWLDPELADFVTLSVGGDDLGFATILDACVLRYQGFLSPNCRDSLWSGIDEIQREVEQKIAQVIRRILDKGNPDLRVFYTGYPQFFNADTKWCDNVTFWFWQPGHHENANQQDTWNYLTSVRRRLLNDLVDSMNNAIQNSIWNINTEYSDSSKHPKIFFVDPNPAWNGHRFCDAERNDGEVMEPSKNRAETWFYLSGWPDNLKHNDTRLPGSRWEAEQGVGAFGHLDQSLSFGRHGEICLSHFEKHRNVTEYTICAVATACSTYHNVTGRPGLQITEDLQIEKDGDGDDFRVTGASWWAPTHWLKTFHPRTLGHHAFKDLIVKAWNSSQET